MCKFCFVKFLCIKHIHMHVFESLCKMYFYLFIYLIFGCVVSSLLHAGFLQLQQAGATLHCGVWASYCGGFSCGAQALGARASVVVARGLQQLWHTGLVVVAHGRQSAGSVVVAHGLSCSAACGIFPDQHLNSCPLYWQADSEPLCHREAP